MSYVETGLILNTWVNLMEPSAIYSKTSKGLRVIAGKSRALPGNLMRVLALVDGKSTIGQILSHPDNFTEQELHLALAELELEGCIRLLKVSDPELSWQEQENFSTMEVAEVSVEEFHQLATENIAQPTIENSDDPHKEILEAEARAAVEAKTREAELATQRAQQEAMARAEVERRAKEHAEQQIRDKAEAQARLDLERKAREEAEAATAAERRARKEAEALATAERKARKQAEANAAIERKLQEEAAAHHRAEEVARRAQNEAEALAQAAAAAKALKIAEAERQARLEAERIAEAERAARTEVEARAFEHANKVAAEAAAIQAEAERIAQERLAAQAEEETRKRLQLEHEASTRAEAEQLAREEAERRAETERTAREQAEAKVEAERAARLAAEDQAAVERKARKKAEAIAKAERKEATKAREAAKRKDKEEAKALTRAAALAKANAIAQAKAQAVAEREARKAARKHESEQAAARLQETIRSRSVKTGFGWLKWTTTTVASLALALVVLYFTNLSGIVPAAKLASDKLNTPVTIGSVHAAFLPEPHLVLTNVKLAAAPDIKFGTIRVFPVFNTLFEPQKQLRLIEIETLTMSSQHLELAQKWLAAANQNSAVHISHIRLANFHLAIDGLSPVDIDIALDTHDRFQEATLTTTDNRFSATLRPEREALAATFTATAWQPSLKNTPIVDELNGKATVNHNSIVITEAHGRVFGGALRATAKLSWSGTWALDSDFALDHADLGGLARVHNVLLLGDSDFKGSLTAKGNSLSTLLDNPTIKASLLAQDGVIGNISLSRALVQDTRSSDEATTRFDKLSGNLELAAGTYRFSQLRLTGRQVIAVGEITAAADGKLSGNIAADMTVAARRFHAKFKIVGNASQPQLQ